MPRTEKKINQLFFAPSTENEIVFFLHCISQRNTLVNYLLRLVASSCRRIFIECQKVQVAPHDREVREDEDCWGYGFRWSIIAHGVGQRCRNTAKSSRDMGIEINICTSAEWYSTLPAFSNSFVRSHQSIITARSVQWLKWAAESGSFGNGLDCKRVSEHIQYKYEFVLSNQFTSTTVTSFGNAPNYYRFSPSATAAPFRGNGRLTPSGENNKKLAFDPGDAEICFI